jgi:predicted Rossmann-fold nucleotide-binding protein
MTIAQIISSDGYVHDIAKKKKDAETVKARFYFPHVSDYILGSLREKKPFIFSARSGNAQIGIKTGLAPGGEGPVIENSGVFLQGLIQNLNPLLKNVLDLFKKGDEIGRIAILDPELRINDVRHYLHKRLFVGRKAEAGYYEGFDINEETDPATGKTCDYISVRLEPYQYQFEPHAVNISSLNSIIKRGRSALGKIRSRVPIDLKTKTLGSGELFIGAIKISLGDIIGVVDTIVEPENQGIEHLPASILDPFRTFRDRQVELYNTGDQDICLDRIKVRIRFFRSTNPLTVPLDKTRIKNGYRLHDLLTTSEIHHLFSAIEPESMGMILNKGRFTQIPKAWEPNGEAQLEIIKQAIFESTSRKPLLHPDRNRENECRDPLEKLFALGGVNSRIFMGRHFPEPEIIDAFRRSGLRTFLIESENPAFEDSYIKKMIRLTHADHSECEFLRYDVNLDKLYTFYHGCFMEPDDKIRFDRVRYWFAFYGSHTREADNRLMISLLKLLAETFGNEMGVVHGGGPGLMKEANDLARQYNIMSIGVAIDLEGENQAPLTTCDGLIKYAEGLRLSRQDHIQKLSNLPIINTGGYGSAEELAISITSMKLHENPLTPVILLDPNGLWEDTRRQIIKISQNKYGPGFIPGLIKPCRDETEALLELSQFLGDPDQWYRTNHIPLENVALARQKSVRIRACSLRQNTMEVFDRPTSDQPDQEHSSDV